MPNKESKNSVQRSHTYGNHWKKHKSLYIKLLSIFAGVGAIAAGTGLVYGITAWLKSDSDYIDIRPYDTSVRSISYDSTAKQTSWVGSDTEPDTASDVMTKLSYEKVYGEGADPANSSYESDNFSYSELVIDGSTHTVLDKSFNESAYLGLVNWVHQANTSSPYDHAWDATNPTDQPNDRISMDNLSDPGNSSSSTSANATKPTSDTTDGFTSVYSSIINNGVKSLVLCGYNHVDPLANFLESSSIATDAGYILLDGEIDGSENVASVLFRADQAAFFAGLAACQYLEDNYDDIYSKVNNGVLAIGTFGGTAIPTVTIFMGGLEYAIWTYNTYALPNLAIDEGYTEGTEQYNEFIEQRTIHLIDNGNQNSFFTGTFVAGDAKLMTQELLAKGADIIFPVAGPQTADACIEIQNQKSPCRVIGVDTDQENGDLGAYTSESSLIIDKYGNDEPIILCSAQKNLSYMTSMILQASAYGYKGYYKDSDGKMVPYTEGEIKDLDDDEANSLIGSYGYVSVGNSNNNGVMVSKKGEPYFVTAMQYIFNDSTIDQSNVLDAFNNKTVPVTNEGDKTLSQILDDNMYFIY